MYIFVHNVYRLHRLLGDTVCNILLQKWYCNNNNYIVLTLVYNLVKLYQFQNVRHYYTCVHEKDLQQA